MNKEELKQYCDVEFQKMDRIAGEILAIFNPEKSEYTIVEHAAIGAFIMNIYRGFENILKEMLIFDKLDVTDSPEWHEKILKKAGEMGILPPDLLQILSQYLSFRSYFVYKCIFDINWDEIKVLVIAMKGVLEKFKTEVYEYIQTI